MNTPSMDAERICSRAGCRQAATSEVVWRNPAIHAADREKIWLACDEHRDFLHDYLHSRGFPVRLRTGAVS